MVTFLLLSGCLIDQDTYDRRLAELLAVDSGGSDTDGGDDTGCARVNVWADADGDGFGNPDYPDARCAPFDGWVENADDCDDTDGDVSPGATEVCATAVDDDCDGAVNEAGAADGVVLYADVDGDGFGAGDGAVVCAGVGWVADATDCDDGDGGVNPGAEEVCGTGVDEDCDAETSCRLEGEVSTDSADVEWEGERDRTGLPSRVGDLSGDGLDDIALAEGTALWLVSPVGSAAPTLSSAAFGGITHSDPTVNLARAAAADFDGDGVPELAVSMGRDGYFTSDVYLFDVPGGVVDESSAREAWIGNQVRSLGFSMTAVDDFNNDGLPELFVSALGDDVTTSLSYLVQPGSADPWDAALIVSGLPSQYSGTGLASHDLDDDGRSDLIVASPGEGEIPDRVLVFDSFEGISDIRTEDADLTITASADTDLGASLVFEPVLDADGDGHADLLLGAPGASAVYLFAAPREGTLSEVDAVATYTGDVGMRLGATLSGGDFDGDGRDDLLIGYWSASATAAAHLDYGPVSGTRDVSLLAGFVDDRFASGAYVHSPGDTNGDGTDDILLSGAGRAWLYWPTGH